MTFLPLTAPKLTHRAACVDTPDPDIFAADAGATAHREAVRICHTCPSRGECLAWATGKGFLTGIWGGKVFYTGSKTGRDVGRFDRNEPADRVCTACGDTFTTTYTTKRYCTQTCASAAARARQRSYYRRSTAPA